MKKLLNFFLIIVIISAVSIIFTGCTRPDYQLSTSIVPTAAGTISPSTGPFKGGSSIVLVATPAQNYEFVGWAGDASGNTNPLTVNMNSNKQIVAQFAKITYSVQIYSNPSDGGTVYPASGTYEAGTQLTFTATPLNGYRFDHWSGDITGNSNKSTLLIATNQTMTAHFTKTYNLTINAPPEVGATVSPGSGVYDAGTSVTITAKATMYPYAFDHWSGTANDNVNPTTVTMNTDKSVTVYFKKLTASPTVDDTQTIWGGGSTNVPIELNQFEWVQGEFWGPYFSVTLLDPNGKIVENLGATFTFNAEIPGRYTIVLHNTNTLSRAAYTLSYTIYR